MYRTKKLDGSWTQWFTIDYSVAGLRRKLNFEKTQGRILAYEIKDI